MTEHTSKPVVRHNAEISQFSVDIEGHNALLEYHLDGDTITFEHTEVPRELEGRGIGSQLARAGLEYARAEALKVIPACSFVAGYIKKHPEYKSLLKSSSETPG